MCSRGVYQLRYIKLQYCDWGGSSRGVRELLQTSKLDEFLSKNPQIHMEAYMSRGKHPYIRSEYINGWNFTSPLKNLNTEEIMEVFERVRRQCGHKAYDFASKKVITTNPSIQGPWKPNFWNIDTRFEDEQLRKLPEFPVQPTLIKKKEKKAVPESERLRRAMNKKASHNKIAN